MKPTRPSEVRALLAELDFRPRKALGQNFLVDANILAILLEAAAIAPDDEVLEVGAGLGVLTEPLAEKARRVVAVEKDRRLCEFLRPRLARSANVELICADMLKLDHEALLAAGITKVVANLPYSVGSAILVNLLQAARPPQLMILTLQLEVARRLTARPGQDDFGLLSLWSQLLYDVAIRKIISPTCFYPAPQVQSAIIRLARRAAPAPDPAERRFFQALTKFAFSRRRKQLGTVLRAAPAQWNLTPERIQAACRKLGIEPQTRPEELAAAQWLALARILGEEAG
jgi:16S rRNA (adenine1518-N6/adenine1519-N6)-dimethyltransferase